MLALVRSLVSWRRRISAPPHHAAVLGDGAWDSGGVPGRVSYMRTATTSPEAAVRAATTQIAARMPNASATMPASRAPTANPPSRQSRYTPTERALQAGWATSPLVARRVGDSMAGPPTSRPGGDGP